MLWTENLQIPNMYSTLIMTSVIHSTNKEVRMENFLKVNNVEDVGLMYGKEVYITIFPDEPEGHFIYKGTLLGYGAYGENPDHKTFCVYVDRGDGYRFVDYFRDKCFRSREEYEEFIRQRKEKDRNVYTVDKLIRILGYKERHIDVKVKVGNMVYPINGIQEQTESVSEPAFVLTVDVESGMQWKSDVR